MAASCLNTCVQDISPEPNSIPIRHSLYWEKKKKKKNNNFVPVEKKQCMYFITIIKLYDILIYVLFIERAILIENFIFKAI